MWATKGPWEPFFEKRLKSQGEFTVYGIDRPFNYSYMDSIFKDLDMVLLCIPAYAIKDVVLGLSSKLNKNTILVDICSVKVLPMEAMLKSHCGPVVGTHPLFGPDPGPDIPLKIAIVRGRGIMRWNL